MSGAWGLRQPAMLGDLWPSGLHNRLNIAAAPLAELAGALLPAPLAVVGCYGAAGSSVLQRTDAGGIAAAYPASAEGQASSSSSDASSVQFSIKTGGKLAPLEAQLLPLAEACTAGGLLRRLVDNYTPVRCTAELVLSASGAVGGSGLAAAFQELEEQLCGSASFYIVSLLGGSSSDGSSSGGGSAALAAGQHALPGLGPFSVLGASWERVPVLRPYERTAPSSGSNGGSSNGCSAPQLSWAPGAATLRHASLCLDVLAYVPRDMPAAEAVGAVVRPAVRRQLRSMRADAEEAAAAGAALMIPNQPPLRALHFLPPGWPHHLTQVGAWGGRACWGQREGNSESCTGDNWRLPQLVCRCLVPRPPAPCAILSPQPHSLPPHPVLPQLADLPAATARYRVRRGGAAASAQGPAPHAGPAPQPPPAARGQRLRR